MAIIKKFRITTFKKEIHKISLKKISLSFNKRQILEDINFNIKDQQDIYLDSNLKFILSIDEFINNQILNFQNIEINTNAKNNIVYTSLAWNNNDSISLGKVSSIIDFKSSEMILANLEEFYLFDSSVGYWKMKGNPSVNFIQDKYSIDSILLTNADQSLILNGNIGSNVVDSLSLEIQDLKLSSLPLLFGINKKKHNYGRGFKCPY